VRDLVVAGGVVQHSDRGGGVTKPAPDLDATTTDPDVSSASKLASIAASKPAAATIASSNAAYPSRVA
jgi:hypothetical protein